MLSFVEGMMGYLARVGVLRRDPGEHARGVTRRLIDASLRASMPIARLAAKVCGRVRREGKRYRASRPWSGGEGRLLEAVSRGEWGLSGFCNRDLAGPLYPCRHPTTEQRRHIGSKVPCPLRFFRAHGLICKSPRRRRYRVTAKGRQIIGALLRSQHATVEQLSATAA